MRPPREPSRKSGFIPMSRFFLCIAVCLLFGTGTVWAKPQHKQSLDRHYGTYLDVSLKRCATCHVVPEGMSDKEFAESDGEWNAFGKRLADLGEALRNDKQPDDIASRLERVADEDA